MQFKLTNMGRVKTANLTLDGITVIGESLNGAITFDDIGSAPRKLPEPNHRIAWLRLFWLVYAPHYQERHGLKALELAGLYKSLACMPSACR